MAVSIDHIPKRSSQASRLGLGSPGDESQVDTGGHKSDDSRAFLQVMESDDDRAIVGGGHWT